MNPTKGRPNGKPRQRPGVNIKALRFPSGGTLFGVNISHLLFARKLANAPTDGAKPLTCSECCMDCKGVTF